MLSAKETQNMKIINFIEVLFQDMRYGWRMLIKRPGLAVLAIIIFALGIGANTVIFSGVYVMLLQNLPYPNADRIALVSQVSKQDIESGISYADFSDWKEQNSAFEQVALYKGISANLTDNDAVKRVTGSLVSKEFFQLLGGRAMIGHIFSEEEFYPGSNRTILLNYVFWKRNFGGNTDVIGQNVNLNNEAFTVIGVMPESFQHPFRSMFWIPLESFENPAALRNRSANNYQMLALLKPGVTNNQAVEEINMLMERTASLHPIDRQQLAARVTSLRDARPGIRKYRTPILVLQFAVVFVLLISSVNLANLLIARNAERRQEFTVRLALGAGRLRLVGQLLTESLLLGGMGSLLGLLLAWWGLGALQANTPVKIPDLAEVGINPQVLLFTLCVSLTTSLGFGLFPALAASDQNLNESLKTSSLGASSDPRRRRLSKWLMVAEVALAVVLLAASGLMIRTFLNLTREDPGFNPDRAIALSLALTPAQYPSDESVRIYFDEAVKKIKSVAGVESAGAVTYMPLIGYNPGTDFVIEGRTPDSPELAPRADFQPVTPDYLEAIEIPLLRGRRFNETDMKPAPEAVIINNALAKKFWPDEDPLGKHIQIPGNDAIRSPLIVVGIVGDVKQFGLNTDPRPEIYLPMHRRSMTLIIRTASEAASVMAALRETIQEIDRDKAAFSLKTMEEVVSDSIDRSRTFAWLLSFLSGVALILAAMGIYGVVSSLVAQRTREIGIRLALGAERRDVMRLVIKQGVGFVAVGVAAGIVLSLALTRFMKSLLFEVSSADPVTFAGIILILMTVALLACLIPARRASLVDPIVTLRHE